MYEAVSRQSVVVSAGVRSLLRVIWLFPCQELSELTRKDAIADFSQSQSPRIKLTAETSKLPPEACHGHPYRTWQELQRRASARYSSWQEAKKSKAVKAEAALAMPKKRGSSGCGEQRGGPQRCVQKD